MTLKNETAKEVIKFDESTRTITVDTKDNSLGGNSYEVTITGTINSEIPKSNNITFSIPVYLDCSLMLG